MKDITDYVSRICSNCDTNLQRLYLLISARGFLLEKQEDLIYVSSNSNKKDAADLDNLLRTLNMGMVIDSQVLFNENVEINRLPKIFTTVSKVGGDPSKNDYDWIYFKYRKHGFKVPALDLEPFIAKYIKALSACGIITSISCDGNHDNKTEFFLDFNGNPSDFWHQWLWEHLIYRKAELPWVNNYKNVNFTKETQYNYYFELLTAANYLYDNRLLLRDLRQHSINWLTRSKAKNMRHSDICNEVSKRANDYLSVIRLNS